MKKKKKFEKRMIFAKKLTIAVFSALLLCLLPFARAEAGTIYDSPYVSISPDGQAWTTCPGDTHNYHYTPGYTVTTGLPSDLRPLQTGEHYYTFDRSGSIPIGRWTVLHQNSQCIHDYIPIDVSHEYHDVPYGTKVCSKEYTQGWFAYCADCGQPVAEVLMYMCEDAAKSLSYIDVGSDMYYFYLCPNFEVTKNEDGSIAAITYCRHLEQGSPLDKHNCKKISWNQYKVVYDDNEASTEGTSLGTMQPSYHMYNNETTYEGKIISPVTRLSKVGYTVPGYEFTGWNTKPDGSGTWYSDQQEILNLTTADYKTDKENGSITLYAQWVRSESTLKIDPAGGSYYGNSGITEVKEPRMSNYILNPSALAVPSGATLSFETYGGTAPDGSAIGSVVSSQRFVDWVEGSPFLGRLVDNTYYFLAPNGNIDTVTAKYAPNPITLPEVKKDNYTFGGWYYDADFKRVAGGAGDSILIYENTTLYANWVDLKLMSVENYREDVNGGKGAADLSWSQPDGQSKFYRVYRGKDADAMTEITRSIASGSSEEVSESFSFSGKSQTFTVPATGLYTLEAAGAQGGGGLGNEVVGNFWLKEGDVLTYDIGGQNGYGGSETGANNYETSGRTAVTSANEGLLLAAGGGGGHTHTSDCYQRAETAASDAFLKAYTVLERDGVYADAINPLVDQAYSNVFAINTHSGGEDTDEIENDTDMIFQIGNTSVQIGDEVSYFPTPGVGTFSFYYQDGVPPGATELYYTMDTGSYDGSWGSYSPDRNANRIIRVYDTKGNQLMHYNITTATEKFRQNFNVLEYCDCDTDEDMWADIQNYTWTKVYYEDECYSGWMLDAEPQNTHYCNNDSGKYFQSGGACVFGGTFTIEIPEEVEGIYILYEFNALYGEEEYLWINNYLQDFKYNYRANICGQSESASGSAMGEKVYVNPLVCVFHEVNENSRAGDGYFEIQSKDIGYLSERNHATVAAPDETAPNAVEEKRVQKLPVVNSNGKQITVCWEQPEDNGSDYYFMVESYGGASATKLCASNITHNLLVTGVAGYYYAIDAAESTIVTASNSYTTESCLSVTLTDTKQYLHLAVVDKAGNLSSTTTVEVPGTVPDLTPEPTPAPDPNPLPIAWPVHTEKITVSEGEGVCRAVEPDTYYVRCDNRTPLELGFGSYLEGGATAEYQITHSIFESQVQGSVESRNIITTPIYAISDNDHVTGAGGLGISAEGAPMLSPYMNVQTVRSNRNRNLNVVSEFVVGTEANEKTIRVTPRVGVETAAHSKYSDYTEDLTNSIYLIGDCVPPVISGAEVLEEEMVIDRGGESVQLSLTAMDTLSGVAAFYASVENENNGGCKSYIAGEDGSILLDITSESSLFAGEFTITLVAIDNVGNRAEQVNHVTELALETRVERILTPHDPVFKRGESGILTVETWGYVERVEVKFPDFLEEHDVTFTYETPQYKEKEVLQFMVPLETEADGSYEILIHAYKGERGLEDVQVITIGGNVLDDLRTRVR